MDNTADFEVRIASPQDAEAVSALLAASYPLLMAFGYDPILFARALPVLTKANPALLSTRTWYVVEALGADDRLVGCGGWARQRPDMPNERVDPILGHIRHFATHPNWTRRGIGRALFDRCVTDARAAGVCSFECYSSIALSQAYECSATSLSQAPETRGRGSDSRTSRIGSYLSGLSANSRRTIIQL